MGGVVGPPQYTIEEGGRILYERIQSGVPFVAGKLGTSEFEALLWFINHKDGVFPLHIQKNMKINAGLFGERCIEEWCAYMLGNAGLMDEIAMWNPISPLQERYFIEKHFPQIKKFLPLRALEPFYQDKAENRWSLAVQTPFCVVSPFVTTIEGQWSRRDELFPFPLFATDDFRGCVYVGYSPLICQKTELCSWPESILQKGWFAGVQSIIDSCVATGAKFVFVGAGALSLPICFELKKRGISAIHTGGGTQLIFGIKGRRWLNHGVIAGFFNDSWVSPAVVEVPSNAERIEGGCYF
jgi:hypothetical protein